MDILPMLMSAMQGQTGQAGTQGAGVTPQPQTQGDSTFAQLAQAMQGVQAPQAPTPKFSGGVSGVGMPFLQNMPDLVTQALNSSVQRMNSVPASPSLGQLIGG